MKVLVTDDGKEKSQSWEATTQKDFIEWFNNANCSLTGYGETKDEAIVKLKEAAIVMIKELQSLIDDETIGV